MMKKESEISWLIQLMPVAIILGAGIYGLLEALIEQSYMALTFSIVLCVYFQFGMISEHANRVVIFDKNIKSQKGIFNKNDIKKKLSVQFLRMSYFLLLWPRFNHLLKSGKFMKNQQGK